MVHSAYLDTSVFGGMLWQRVFRTNSWFFFKRISKEKIKLIVSEILTSELENAPDRVKNLLNKISEKQIQRVDVNPESKELAKSYISEMVVGKTSYADCLHIALATLSIADILVSWNFKHIVNIDRIRGYNSVNLKLGYKMIEIYSPLQLRNYV